MSDDRLGGAALIAGAAAGIVTMALHPTGHDLMAPGQFAHVARLSVGAHALALAGVPLSFLGTLALSRRLSSPDRLALAALVTYGFSLLAVMSAAVCGGLVPPAVMGRMLALESPPDAWRIVLEYNYRLNQAFAQVFVVGSSAAIVLWSAAILRGRALSRGLGIYGCLIGPLIVLALLSGYLRLNVHGFGAVVLGQAIWLVTAGVGLLRTAGTSPPGGA